ncbi:MAG: hypothetical protein JW860_08675 [Sedimentisphaerales bacterium]|nr:hypothetical protein [Sedimentisphaerales bacterium]
MKTRRLFLLIFILWIQVAGSIIWAEENQQAEAAAQKTEPSIVTIQEAGGRYELTRNGRPFFINGAGGSRHLDELVKAGGNSIRTWSSSKEVLDKAYQKDLMVCIGLSMQKPRHGANYQDITMLKEQRDRIYNKVIELKDHPAVLMWGIGNEVEHQTSRDISIQVWKEIETIAKMIKEIDSNHPVITVIAGAGRKLEDIKQYCPTLDAIGINTYGKLEQVPVRIKQYGWQKPYLITEFGPRGWWEVPKTTWGLPIEDTSTEKAQFYYTAYKAGIDNKPNCLGSYVFFWGNKQEKTHTWFNMFLPDGSPTEMVDTMTLLWTGQWPENRAPRIGSKKIYTASGDQPHIYQTSSKVTFRVQAQDPEGDDLSIKWDLRRDESDNPATGGDWEKRIPPIAGAVLSSESDKAVIMMPAKAGNYRIFTNVFDPAGKAATVNLPIKVTGLTNKDK